VYIQIFETNILRLLEEHDMTKQELADKADISISFLSDLTHGKANPSLKIMQSIADAFEVPLPYLLESTELSFEQLAELRQDSPAFSKPSLPAGYERVSAILPAFQAFQVRQWAEAARKRLRR
jgi:transcriptional regulator with XRE-family HTH domain